MNWFSRLILICILVQSASAQSVVRSSETNKAVIWEPQLLLEFADDATPHPSIPKEMIASLLLSDVKVLLEETLMDTIQAKFGGEVGARGDASESLRWLCVHGVDEVGPWVLWLESGEIDGPYIGGFQWRRLSGAATFDMRCASLPDTAKVVLPINLRLGTSREEVLNVLGKPTWQTANIFLYEHEHEETIRGEPYDSWNSVIIAIRNGVIEAIDVTKTTSN